MAAATTSELGGFIRGILGNHLLAEDPADTGASRNAIVNNLNHLTDSCGQCLVNFVSPTTAYALPAPSTSAFTRFTNLPPFLVPVRVRTDGSTMRLVVNLRASISAAGTATFRVFARFPTTYRGGPPDPSLGYVAVAEDSTTSTTAADLGPKIIYGTQGLVRSVIDDGFLEETDGVRADGERATAPVLMAQIEIWAKTSLITSVPRIHSFSVREYIGE